MNHYSERYRELEKQLKADHGHRLNGSYQGQPTKRAIRRQQLELLQQHMDHLRWSAGAMQLSLRRAVFKEDL